MPQTNAPGRCPTRVPTRGTPAAAPAPAAPARGGGPGAPVSGGAAGRRIPRVTREMSHAFPAGWNFHPRKGTAMFGRDSYRGGFHPAAGSQPGLRLRCLRGGSLGAHAGLPRRGQPGDKTPLPVNGVYAPLELGRSPRPTPTYSGGGPGSQRRVRGCAGRKGRGGYAEPERGFRSPPPSLTASLDLCRVCVPPPGPSGKGRRRWAWSCWPRLATTPPCRGCSPRPTSTRRAWSPTWTPAPLSTCTADPARRPPPSRDPWCPASSSTDCRAAASPPRPCPPCPASCPGPRSPGEPRFPGQPPPPLCSGSGGWRGLPTSGAASK